MAYLKKNEDRIVNICFFLIPLISIVALPLIIFNRYYPEWYFRYPLLVAVGLVLFSIAMSSMKEDGSIPFFKRTYGNLIKFTLALMVLVSSYVLLG